MSENTKAHLLPILADHVCQSLRSRVDGYCVFSTLDGMSRLPTSCRYSISVSLAFMDMVGAEAETIFKYLPK
ncbi:MAG: hypothetical protein J6M06_00715, partial [Synergistaceae bacterium]|nr:hypothetical protein [Synergistaceae bacterium]